MRAFPLLAVLACALVSASCIEPGTPDEGAPDTTIDSGPSAETNQESVTFEFSSDDERATFLCALDAGEEFECESPLTVDTHEEGAHLFEVRAVSGGQEDPSPASYEWQVDTTPPDTTITEGPPEVSSEVNVTFEFSSTEAGSTFRCRLDDALEEDCSSGRKGYSGLSVGSHTFSVYSTDRAGNKDDSPAMRTATVDAQGPIVTITSGPSTGGMSGPDVTFTFETTLAGATFECRLDGTLTACDPAGVTFSGLVHESTHTFQVRASTPLGTTGPTTSVEFTVDGQGPVITITSPPEESVTGPLVTLSFTSDDGVEAGATFECTLDGEPRTCIPEVDDQVLLAAGPHTFTVFGVDQYGNSYQAHLSWVVDGQGPIVQILSPQAGVSYGNRVPVTVDGFDSSGPVTFHCQLDGGSIDICPSSLTVSHGQHTLTVRGRDVFGNVGPEASVSFNVN